MIASCHGTLLIFKKFSKCPHSGCTKISDQNLLLSLQLHSLGILKWHVQLFVCYNPKSPNNIECWICLIHLLVTYTFSWRWCLFYAHFWLSGSFLFCGVLCTVLYVIHRKSSSLDLADVLPGLWSDFAFSWYVSDNDYSNRLYSSWQAFVSWIVFLMLFL